MSSAIINFFLYTFFSSALLAHFLGFSPHLSQNYANRPSAKVLGAAEASRTNRPIPPKPWPTAPNAAAPQAKLAGRHLAALKAGLSARQPINLPVVQASAGLLKDLSSQKILFAKQPQTPHSLASLTKLMTALVFLDHNPGWETIYKIKQSDRRWGGKIYLYLGDKVTVKDLFYASLVGSANTATAALVASTGLSEEEFVEAMNKKALAWGFKKTIFYEPTGLDQRNVASPLEIAVLAQKALAQPAIAQATITKTYSFKTQQGRPVIIPSTDYLLDIFPYQGIKILGGKTGYNERAGYCFVGLFSLSPDRRLISVILGAKTKKARFIETKKLIEWGAKQALN